MPLYNSENFSTWLLLYVLFAMLYARGTYLANRRLPDDDPQKRYYPRILIVLAPVTLPLFLLVSIFVFIVQALLYGLSMVAFMLGLLFAAVVAAARKAGALHEK